MTLILSSVIAIFVLTIILFIAFLRCEFYKKGKFDSNTFWFYVASIFLLGILVISTSTVRDRINYAEKANGSTTLTKKEEFEWMELFEEKKKEANTIQQEIAATDKAIDKMVYDLYGLNE